MKKVFNLVICLVVFGGFYVAGNYNGYKSGLAYQSSIIEAEFVKKDLQIQALNEEYDTLQVLYHTTNERLQQLEEKYVKAVEDKVAVTESHTLDLVKAVDNALENNNKIVEDIKAKSNSYIEDFSTWSSEKWNNTKEWSSDKWNNTKEWFGGLFS